MTRARRTYPEPRWLTRLDRLPSAGVAGAVCGVVLLIGVFDYLTGTNLSLSAFYLVPVSLAALRLGIRPSLLVSCACVVVWAASGMLANDEDFALQSYDLWWNAFTQLSIYCLVAWTLTSLRALQRSLETRVRERAADLTREISARERLQRELLRTGEREQRRIAQDLHDGLCQHLTGTALTAQALSEKLASGKAVGASEADTLVQRVEEGIAISHRLASGLHPLEIEHPDGLVHALELLVQDMNEQHEAFCTLDCTETVAVRDRAISEHLYRIAQEAMRNAIRHGRASEIVVSLLLQAGTLNLLVEDNGTGFDPGGEQPTGGLGLRIMAYRCDVIGASFRVRGRDGSGTMVEVVLPAAEADAPILHARAAA